MDLSTALTIILFFYAIFLILLGIEYFTDKRRGRKAPPQEKREPPKEPQKSEEKAAPLDDLEAEEKGEEKTEAPVEVPVAAPGEEAKSPAETVGAPKIWEEEEFE